MLDWLTHPQVFNQVFSHCVLCSPPSTFSPQIKQFNQHQRKKEEGLSLHMDTGRKTRGRRPKPAFLSTRHWAWRVVNLLESLLYHLNRIARRHHVLNGYQDAADARLQRGYSGYLALALTVWASSCWIPSIWVFFSTFLIIAGDQMSPTVQTFMVKTWWCW